MSQFVVRNLKAVVLRRLKRRAAVYGLTLDEEVHDILRAAADAEMHSDMAPLESAEGENETRHGRPSGGHP